MFLAVFSLVDIPEPITDQMTCSDTTITTGTRFSSAKRIEQQQIDMKTESGYHNDDERK